MVRKGKSLLFGHISRIFKKNGGGTATTAENRHLPPIFLPFLAELDISEQLIFFFKYSKCQMQNLREFFFKKKVGLK